MNDLAAVLTEIDGKSAQLDALDDRLSFLTTRIEDLLREEGIQRVIFVQYRDGMQLAWSWARPSQRHRQGRWRLVVRDGDSIDELHSLTREERADVWLSGTMQRLVEEAVPGVREQLRNKVRLGGAKR